VLDFLLREGHEVSAAHAHAHAVGPFLNVAKAVTLFLARAAPQQTIDHLVCELSQRLHEPPRDPPPPPPPPPPR